MEGIRVERVVGNLVVVFEVDLERLVVGIKVLVVLLVVVGRVVVVLGCDVVVLGRRVVIVVVVVVVIVVVMVVVGAKVVVLIGIRVEMVVFDGIRVVSLVDGLGFLVVISGHGVKIGWFVEGKGVTISSHSASPPVTAKITSPIIFAFFFHTRIEKTTVKSVVQTLTFVFFFSSPYIFVIRNQNLDAAFKITVPSFELSVPNILRFVRANDL